MSAEDRKFVQDTAATLKRQQTLLKQAAAKSTSQLTKIASLEREVQILRDVIGLVTDGQIDPSDASDKVAMFLEDPEQLEVVKKALALGMDQPPVIGSLVDDETSSLAEEDNPIAAVLRENEPRLRRV